MAKKSEGGSSSKASASRLKTILGVIIIFGLGYFAGMNHQTTAKVYVESEPQRKEAALKTVQISKTAWDQTARATTNVLHFLGEKLSSVGSTEAKKETPVMDKVGSLKK
jgi:hypothetical protein